MSLAYVPQTKRREGIIDFSCQPLGRYFMRIFQSIGRRGVIYTYIYTCGLDIPVCIRISWERHERNRSHRIRSCWFPAQTQSISEALSPEKKIFVRPHYSLCLLAPTAHFLYSYCSLPLFILLTTSIRTTRFLYSYYSLPLFVLLNSSIHTTLFVLATRFLYSYCSLPLLVLLTFSIRLQYSTQYSIEYSTQHSPHLLEGQYLVAFLLHHLHDSFPMRLIPVHQPVHKVPDGILHLEVCAPNHLPIELLS